MSAGKHAADSKDFYLKEYECLRKEIEWMLKDYRSLERNVVIAVGVTWGWLFEHNKALPRWAWLIPCLFAALGSIRAAGIMKAFGNFRTYIVKIEDAFSSHGDPGGWNRFHPKNIGTSRMAGVFWAVLILATVLVAFINRHAPGIVLVP